MIGDRFASAGLAYREDAPAAAVTPVTVSPDTPATSDSGDRSDTPSRPRTVWTAAELLAADFPEPRWAVPKLIPEGVTLLAGAPKIGKSWLGLGAALAVATGGVALGRVTVERGPALYLALEDPPRRLKDRLGRMLRHGGGDPAPGSAPDTLTLVTACPSLPNGGAERVGGWLEHAPDTRLVVVDVLARMRGPTPPGVSPYEADYSAVAQFKALADTHRVAIVLVHHVRKADAADFLDTVSGTNGLAGAADTVLVLKRSRGQADAVLHLTGRDVEEAEYAMKFTPTFGTWELLDGPALDYTLGKTRAAILAHVREQGDTRPKAVAEALDLVENTARQTMGRMVHDGQLDTNGNGLYFPVAE
jgi:hypothetical protein